MIDQTSSKEHSIRIRVASPSERLRLQVGSCRLLDDRSLDRTVLLALAAEFCLDPEKPVWLSQIASLLGIPMSLVWEVVVRHELFNEEEDAWIEVEYVNMRELAGLDDDVELLSDFVSVRLSARWEGFPQEFLALAVLRWPDDLAHVSSFLVSTLWNRIDDDDAASAYAFLGYLLCSVDPFWWALPLCRAVEQTSGNQARLMETLPFHERNAHSASWATKRWAPPAAKEYFLASLARKLLAVDFGDLPGRIRDGRSSEWELVTRLLNTLLCARLPGVNERLQEILLERDRLLDFLAHLVAAEPADIEPGMDLLFESVTATESGASRLVDVLRACRGYDLPPELRDALVQRPSIGLAAATEVLESAKPGLGGELLAVFAKWRSELALLPGS